MKKYRLKWWGIENPRTVERISITCLEKTSAKYVETEYTAIFPVNSTMPGHEQDQEKLASKLCDYLNEREEHLAAAEKALAIATRMTGTNP